MTFLTKYVTKQVDPLTKREVNSLNLPKIIGHTLTAIAVVTATLVYWPLTSVPTGTRGVVTVGGEITSLKSEGFVLIAPWQKLSNFNIRAEASQVNAAEGATSDTQPVHVTLTVRYSVNPDKVAVVFEQFSKTGDLDTYVDTATREAFKAVTAKYTAPELISQRAKVSSEIVQAIRLKVAVYHANVISVDVTSFVFSPDYMANINKKVNQDQALQTAEKEALTVAAQQKSKVATAEGEATALKLKADAEAYANLKIATAQADALKIQNAALTQSKEVLELRRIEVEKIKAERWDGALPQHIYAGTPIPFFTPK
jgi:regulator of protease activity HflC (stomatin/prohibitin superfamily)